MSSPAALPRRLLVCLGAALGCASEQSLVQRAHPTAVDLVDDEAPFAHVIAPLDGALLPDDVVLAGIVADREDPVDALLVTWTSSLDGALSSLTVDAEGGVTGVVPLSWGTHLLTLRVIDTAGQSATDGVTVLVGGEVPDGDTPDEVPDGEEPCGDEAASWDLDADFSATDNPNCAWSYGWTGGLGTAFVLGTAGVRDGLDGWMGWLAGDGNPSLLHNSSATEIRRIDGVLAIPPGVSVIHPGPGGEYGVVRWVAPDDARFTVRAEFTDVDVGATDAHVLVDEVPVFHEQVDGTGATYVDALDLRAGDTVDFAVGSSGPFYGDTTRITVHIDR